MTRIGRNPYSSVDWTAAYTALKANIFASTHYVYGYPPHLAVSMIPISLLPYNQAFIVWMTLSQLAMVVSLFLLMSLWKTEKAKLYILPILLSTVLFRPLWTIVLNGQIAAMLLLAPVMAIWLWEHNRWFLRGILLSFLAFKTTFSIPILLLTTLWLLASRRWYALLGLCLMAVGLTILDLPRLSDWFATLINTDARIFNVATTGSLTVWGVANTVCGTNQLCANLLGGSGTVLLAGGLGVVLCLQRRRLRPLAAMSLIVPVSLLVFPYMWAYDQIMLVLPITYIVLRLIEYGYPYMISALAFLGIAVVAILLLILADSLEIDVWSAALSALVLVLVVLLIREPPLPEQEAAPIVSSFPV